MGQCYACYEMAVSESQRGSGGRQTDDGLSGFWRIRMIRYVLPACRIIVVMYGWTFMYYVFTDVCSSRCATSLSAKEGMGKKKKNRIVE